MTLQQLKKLYIEYNRSLKHSDRVRAQGYAQVIDAYNNLTDSKEYYEEVKISLIAENLLKVTMWMYKNSEKEDYKWQSKGINDCIIGYATDVDLSTALVRFHGDITEDSIFNYINSTPYKGKVKYDSVHSLCEIMKLSI